MRKKIRDFNYSLISKKTWNLEILDYIAAIYKKAGKQKMYLKKRPEEWEKLVEIAKIQITEALKCDWRYSYNKCKNKTIS